MGRRGETGSFSSRLDAQEGQGSPGLQGRAAAGSGDIWFAGQAHQTVGQVAQGGHHRGDVARAHLGTARSESDITGRLAVSGEMILCHCGT